MKSMKQLVILVSIASAAVFSGSAFAQTTMDPSKRILLKVMVEHEARDETSDTVERLMGNKPEARFIFIQERAAFAGELIDL